MSPETHSQLKNDIWEICNLLRGPYKRNEYRKVILPLTVLKRFDSILVSTKQKVLDEHKKMKGTKVEKVIDHKLTSITGYPFYNLSKLDFAKLQDDPDQIGPNLISYINGFSKNIRSIMERFEFADEIRKMTEKDILYNVLKEFNTIDLSLEKVNNMQMGYIFEELIRIGAEQSNEEAGEHFTPREVIQLMVDILLANEDLGKSKVVKKIYDPACGTGGMLSTAEKRIKELNNQSDVHLYGQDWNDGAWAVCQADILIKGEEPEKIKLGCTFTQDGFKDEQFDFMLANPPFGVSWKQQETFIKKEEKLGHSGRFGAGLPRVNDGSLLFLQHMISKMIPTKQGGSRIGIVFNGSPLFTGDAGSGESDIRQWIIENDWLETVIALPDQLFYNTGISTYIWIVTNNKESRRKGKVQLIDARNFWVKMKKSLGNKRKLISDGRNNTPDHLQSIVKIYDKFRHDQKFDVIEDGNQKSTIVSKVFDNEDFGYNKIVVERPLKLNFKASPERIALLEDQSAFASLATSKKKKESARQEDIKTGKERQKKIRDLLASLDQNKVYLDRKEFLIDLREKDRAQEVRLSAPEIKAIIAALSEKDEEAVECKNNKGEIEPDSDLRDTENVPLKEAIDEYMKREVLPHVPDAWVDESKTKIGYEIPLNQHFYQYTPPRDIADIVADIKLLENDIVSLLKQVTNGENHEQI